MHHVTKIRLCWKINMKNKYCKYNTYLFFTDLMVDLVLKSLFDPGKRHMSIIFGNILTEAEGERTRKRKTLIHFPYRITNERHKSHYLSIWELQFFSTCHYQSDSPQSTFPWLTMWLSGKTHPPLPPPKNLQPRCLIQSFTTLASRLDWQKSITS